MWWVAVIVNGIQQYICLSHIWPCLGRQEEAYNTTYSSIISYNFYLHHYHKYISHYTQRKPSGLDLKGLRPYSLKLRRWRVLTSLKFRALLSKMTTPTFALIGLIRKLRWPLILNWTINYVYCDDILNSSLIQHVVSASPAGHICDNLLKHVLLTPATYTGFRGFTVATRSQYSKKSDLFLMIGAC
jgi:hypothetical protein